VLGLKASADGDADLFRSRQDPTDTRWHDLQVSRYPSNPGGFAPAPGLAPADRASELTQIHLFGHTARVELLHWFQYPGRPGDELSQPMPFHTTWFYRQDDQGVWHHIPPPGDYWGVPYVLRSSRLVILTTEAEATVLNPLAGELASFVSQGCIWLGCSDGDSYTLRFSDLPAPQVRGDLWALPALHLTGLPQSDPARAAFLHALKRWVVEALVQTQVAREDLTNRVIYRQLVARLEAELDLRVGSTPSELDIEPISPDLELLTQGLEDRDQSSLGRLWQATYDPGDPVGMRLVEAEVAALLDFTKEQVGSERLFELLPALRDYPRLSDALSAIYGLDPADFRIAWAAYLAKLTGTSAEAVPAIDSGQAFDQPIQPPPISPPPAVPPGDQIAFICDYRIWVGNADGSDLFPLTASGQGFYSLDWSPDGRWLLAVWQRGVPYARGAIYLLAADGSEGRLLTYEPALDVSSLGWSPDGRQAIFFTGRGLSGTGIGPEVWALEVETGETHRLQGIPTWSPNGKHVIYGTDSSPGGGNRVWLADTDPEGRKEGNWETLRLIADQASITWQGGHWSPDSSRVAVTLVEDHPDAGAIAIYDLPTARLTTLITPAELTAALLSSDGDYVTDGAEFGPVASRPLQWVWPLGWSADGHHLLVRARGTDGGQAGTNPSVLASIPLDRIGDTALGSALKILAYGTGRFLGSASWSPTHPERLTFTWLNSRSQSKGPHGFLFDLKAGPIYQINQSWDAASPALRAGASGSPDGAWVAFAGQDQITIVGRDGQERYRLENNGPCFNPVWNPVADLSGLGETSTS
jgi:Tol biopolymer transport system component